VLLWLQRDLELMAPGRGFHLITDRVTDALPELEGYACGVLQVFILHTSASLTVNEDVCDSVLADFSSWFDQSVPESFPHWTHTAEGPDDMPAHVKSSLLDSSVTIPIRMGTLALGRYQGIYLCEHRTTPLPRTLVLTAWGERRTA
jgi:secondary thiamine-phosphate synthase enzyme